MCVALIEGAHRNTLFTDYPMNAELGYFFFLGKLIPMQLRFEDTAACLQIFHRAINSQISKLNYSLQIICSFLHCTPRIIAITHSSHNVDFVARFYFSSSLPLSRISFLYYDAISLKYLFTTKFQIASVCNIIATFFHCPKQIFKLKRSDSHCDLREKDVTKVIMLGSIHCEDKE